MRMSKPRREIYKQTIRNLIAVRPQINNLQLASEVGVHRNTVTKLLDEIRIENQKFIKERWNKILNDFLVTAKLESEALSQLWLDSYRTLGHSHPSQLVAIERANWSILKDIYRIRLEYLGIREGPKSLVQVNIKK